MFVLLDLLPGLLLFGNESSPWRQWSRNSTAVGAVPTGFAAPVVACGNSGGILIPSAVTGAETRFTTTQFGANRG